MDEIELTRILMGNEVTSPYFCGVISHDQLNLRPTPPEGFFVCNTDASDGPGEHWLVLAWINQEEPIEFFDSLAKSPDNYHLNFENFLMTQGSSYKYSIKRIQASDSIMCGQFCVFYAYHRCKGYSMEDILAMFSSSDLHRNDIIVDKFVNNL